MIKFTSTPSLLIIGNVMRFHKKLKWFQNSHNFNSIKNELSIVKLI